jgi:hypothetical protein
MDYIEINSDELYLFENSNEFLLWLIELHEEYELEDITELKKLVVELEMYDFYLSCKEFEEKYMH